MIYRSDIQIVMKDIKEGDWVYGLHHGKPIVGILDFYDHRLPCPYVLEGEGSCVSVRAATEKEILEEKKRRGETEVEKPSNYYYSGDEGFLEYIGKSDSIFKHGDIANIERREDFNDGSRTYHLTCGRMMTTDQKGNNSDFYYHKDKPTPSFESIWDKRLEISFPTGVEINPTDKDLKPITKQTLIDEGLDIWGDYLKNTSMWDRALQTPSSLTKDQGIQWLYDYEEFASHFKPCKETPKLPLFAWRPSLFRSTPRTEVLTKTKTKKKLNLKFRTK